MALVVGSLGDGSVERVITFCFLTSLIRAPGSESPNYQGRGTQWSVGVGGGLVRWGDGLQRPGRDGPTASAARTFERGTIGIALAGTGLRVTVDGYDVDAGGTVERR